MRHGLYGVGAQIHGYLMHISSVPDDRRIACLEPALQADVGGQGCLEEFKRLADDRLNVHGGPVAEPTAADSKNSLDQQSAAFGRVHDVVEVASHLTLLHGM